MSAEPGSWERAVLWLRQQPEQQALVRDCFYDDPLLGAAKRYAASSEWRALQTLLPRAGSALDLGAGRGITSYALASAGWATTAIEPDASDVVGAGAIRKLAQSAGLAIDVIVEFGESLPLAASSFDLVHCRAVLHHAHDLNALCREISRVLRPGGVLVATREHVLSRREDLPRFLAEHPLHHLYGGENAYLLDDYLNGIQAAGLRIRRVLNPYESDVNMFPDSREQLKARIAKRVALPSPRLVPDWVLRWLGERSQQPGRLYTFVACKPEHG